VPAPAAAGRPTLIPTPGDPVNVDEVTLPGKPAAVLVGQSTWDDGFQNLKNAFRKIEEELTRAAIAPAGRPLTVFVETEDLGFRYEAMIPIPAAPPGRATLTPEVRFGKTPEGKALRFVHKDTYEEIDSTYETIEAYLEAKGIAVKSAFVEEYVTDLIDAKDPNLEINVFVQPQ
jgi:effector-binding domain-containing protein